MSKLPQMLYFGPWAASGHYFFTERGTTVWDMPKDLPWSPGTIDCVIQPGAQDKYHGEQIEGNAALIHRNGWTALSFWDRSVDKRRGCNSTYFARGSFTFDQMVEMAKDRFAVRWAAMNFLVKFVERVDL